VQAASAAKTAKVLGIEVDHQLALHRQVGRLLALEDAVDVASRAPVRVKSDWDRRKSGRRTPRGGTHLR
jgi:hypothetical protein